MKKADIPPAPTQSEQDARFAQLVDAVIDRIQAGEQVDLSALVTDNPQDASRLRRLLPTLEAMAAVGHLEPSAGAESTSSQGHSPRPGVLGDYKILGEIGRGGMGVVYEAQQISLDRRVALKVLPFASVMDPRHLTRFKNEAQAAATLDHPSIVPVYAIGCDRGVHYFAMRYITGQTLAQVLRDLRIRENPHAIEQQNSETISYLPAANSGLTSDHETGPHAADDEPTVRAHQAAISTEFTADSRRYFRSVARLISQAAEALDHAHQHGILHRDVKPGNLMLDADGKLWVTDFGLARIQGDAGMTMTGDLVGTLRYMSPEQALAKRVVVDHRADIYSLGVTLYELLTLRPAFVGDDRQELLRQIAFDEPLAPRAINRAIPSELETITLKAMAKDPRDRYATAQELADDLQRFLSDQPIHARRPSLAQIARKWSRRHRAVVSTAGVVATCTLLVGAGLLWNERTQTLLALSQAEQERERAEQERATAETERARAEAEKARADANYRQAQQSVDKYFTAISQNRLLDTPGMESLRQELLESAVANYQEFVARNADDSGLKAELAAAHIRLAYIYSQLGSDRWIDEYQQVLDIIEPLVEQGGDVSQWNSLREGVLFKEYRGGTIETIEVAANALPVISRAIAVWEKLASSHTDVTGFASDLAGFHAIYGLALLVLKVPDDATAKGIASIERAFTIWEQQMEAQPDAGSGRSLAMAPLYSRLSSCYANRENWEDAYRCAHRSLQLYSDPAISFGAARDEGLLQATRFMLASARNLNRNAPRQEVRHRVEMMDTTAWDALTFNARANVYEELGEYESALADYDRASELEPQNPRWPRVKATRKLMHVRKQIESRRGQIEGDETESKQ